MKTLLRHLGALVVGYLAAGLTYVVLPIVLAYPTGMLSALAGFSLVPFSLRACRDRLVCGVDRRVYSLRQTLGTKGCSAVPAGCADVTRAAGPAQNFGYRSAASGNVTR